MRGTPIFCSDLCINPLLYFCYRIGILYSFHWSVLSVQLILPEPEMSQSQQYMPRVLLLLVVLELCLGIC